MPEQAAYLAGMGAGVVLLGLAWRGRWKAARITGLVLLAGLAGAAGSRVVPTEDALGAAGCLAGLLWCLHRRQSVIVRSEREAAGRVGESAGRLDGLKEEEARLDAQAAEVDHAIEGSRRIYEVSRDLGGAITMSEFRRELGRLFGSLLSPGEALLVYADTESSEREFFRTYDLLEGTRIKDADLPESHPVRAYFADPTTRGVLALEKGPKGPERAVIYLSFREQVIGGIYLDGISVRRDANIEPRVLMYTLAVLVNLANNKCLLYLEIERTSRYDALTGVFKRWYFEQDLMKTEVERSLAEGRSFVVLMLDIDHFKDFNDTYGHLAGDEVLGMLGAFLKEHVRTQDMVCRYGGEEFVLALLDTDRAGARMVAERLRAAIAERPVSIAEAISHITVSIGGAVFPEESEEYKEVVYLADEAMYRAKREGRNKVFFHGDP